MLLTLPTPEHTHSCSNQKCLQILSNVSRQGVKRKGGKIIQFENHCSRLLITIPPKCQFPYLSTTSNIKEPPGTSLAVQWLRLHASKAGGTGLTPGQGTKIPHSMARGKEKKSHIISLHSYFSVFSALFLSCHLRSSISNNLSYVFELCMFKFSLCFYMFPVKVFWLV